MKGQISLKEQLRRERVRKEQKLKGRKGPKLSLPQIRLGNKDHGIPFKGKDVFSGQLRKFADRHFKDEETGITHLVPYTNNKYTESG